MLLSFAVIILSGLAISSVCKKIKVPPLAGMLIAGIILGPHVLGLIDGSVMELSPQLRKTALIIILTRAGLNFDIESIRKNGRPALLMCFLPALCEICGMVLIAPKLFGITVPEAALAGAVLAAVSPAVVVPAMIKLTENKTGTDKGIPQIIMAGASADDIFVITLFSSLCGLVKTGEFSVSAFADIPVSIILGIAAGIASGLILHIIFTKIHIRDTVKLLITLSVSFILVTLEDFGKPAFSGLIAIMAMGIALTLKTPVQAKRLSAKYSKLWVAAELLLFVLVGAEVNIDYAMKFGLKAVALIFAVMFFRMLGVFLCMLKTKLNFKERLFCMLAYIPKATVQASVGSIPLSMGLDCGNLVLTIAVLAILITAPLGAAAIDLTSGKLLSHDGNL